MNDIEQMKFKLVRVIDAARAYWIDGNELSADETALLGWDSSVDAYAQFGETELGGEVEDDDGDIWERVQ